MPKILTLLIAATLALTACSSHDDEQQPASLPVNYANIAGEWQLVEFNGNAIDGNTYVTITFERRNHVFQMRDNLQSMYGQQRTGTYTLTDDEATETTVLSGTYDNGVGEWAHEYTVSWLTDSELHLTTTDEPKETSKYTKIIGNKE